MHAQCPDGIGCDGLYALFENVNDFNDLGYSSDCVVDPIDGTNLRITLAVW